MPLVSSVFMFRLQTAPRTRHPRSDPLSDKIPQGLPVFYYFYPNLNDNTMNYRIDTVKKSDLPALKILYKELIDEPSELSDMERSFDTMANDPAYQLLGVRNASGELTGSVLSILCTDIFGACRPFLVIENLIVRSDCRGTGIGHLLMEHAEKRARRHGCGYTMLVSDARRERAHRFYRSLGYTEEKGFKKYFLPKE